MGSYNRAVVCGYIGRDAEMRYTQGGTAVANFSLATSEKFKGRDGEDREETEWHNIVVWGKTAEAIGEYLKKGRQVLVEGKIQTRKWEDRDGGKRTTTEIRSERIVLLGDGGSSSGAGGGRRSNRAAQTAPADDIPPGVADDDIPF